MGTPLSPSSSAVRNHRNAVRLPSESCPSSVGIRSPVDASRPDKVYEPLDVDLAQMTDEELDEMVRKADADMRKMLPADVYVEIKAADDEYLRAGKTALSAPLKPRR
jgi:hypothetical protein